MTTAQAAARPPSVTPPSANPYGLLGNVGPLSLLLGSGILMAGGLTMPALLPGAIAAGILAVTLVVLAGRHSIGWLRLLPGVLAFASVTWSNWLLADPRDLAVAALAGLRVAYFVIPGIVLAAFIDPSALGDQLGQRLRVPARPVLAAVAALHRLDSLAQDWEQIERARRIRGLGPGRNPIARARHLASMTFALLVQALRQAERTSVAMEARGYGLLARRGYRRTWAGPAPWFTADTVLVVICVALAALPWIVATLL